MAVNKVDDLGKKDLLIPFYSLGIKEIVPVSASQNWQIAELLEEALKTFPRNAPKDEVKDEISKLREELNLDD